MRNERATPAVEEQTSSVTRDGREELMQEYIDQFCDHLTYERNVSPHTLRNYHSDLIQFYDYIAPADAEGNRRSVDVKQLDNLTIREYMSSLYEQKRKKTSIARKLATLRTFFKFLCREEVLKLNPARLVASPRLEKKLPVTLSIDDVVRFIEAPDTDTPLGRRDRAILELLYGTGMRVSELCGLSLEDVDYSSMSIRVKGKGRKERIIPFGEKAKEAMELYLGVRGELLAEADEADRDPLAMFLNYQGTRISTRSVGRMVDKYLKICADMREHQSALAATLVCHAPSQRGRRSPFDSRASWPCATLDDAEVHARVP